MNGGNHIALHYSALHVPLFGYSNPRCTSCMILLIEHYVQTISLIKIFILRVFKQFTAIGETEMKIRFLFSQKSRLHLVAMLAVLFSACAHFGAAPADDRLAPGAHAAVINGAKISYHVHGKGPICIVQPGGPGIAWNYLRMPALEEHLTLVYIEPVGSGASGRLANPSDYTFERYANDIEGLRRHLGLARFYLLGHSHGGMVALEYAVNHSDNLKGLILFSTAAAADKEWMDDLAGNLGWFEKEPWFKEALPAFMGIGVSKTSEEATALFKKAAGFYFADYTANKERIDAVLANMQFNLAPYQAFFTQSFDVRPRLHRIHAPTLIVGAEKDAIISLKFSEHIHNAIPGSQLSVLKKSGHMGHFDQPGQLAAIISGFAVDVENTRGGE